MSKEKTVDVAITPPNMNTVGVPIYGTAPLVQLSFPQKAIEEMRAKHEAGSKAKKGAKKEPRDFHADYENAMHRATEGWIGVPAAAFRNAMISACKIVGFMMTRGKLAIFVEADGIDIAEGTPLVKLDGEPEMVIHHVRNATGVADLRARAMFREWKMMIRIRYDADIFSLTDIMNLMARAGLQVGIGEGRADSKKSAGMGWGHFAIEEAA